MGILNVGVLAVALAAPAISVNNAPPDGWITTKAKLSLWTNGNMKSRTVHVDTIDGVVTLYGTVIDDGQKELAERTVKDVKGVKGVRDLLQVVPVSEAQRVARNDADIKAEVVKALRDDPALKGSAITVRAVNRGVVLLSGKAQSISDQLRAVADVDKIDGVRRVATQLEGPEMYTQEEKRLATGNEPKTPMGPLRTSLTDTRITTEVKLNLLGTPDVPWNNINVDTMDGVVTLFGTVPSDNAKIAATGQAEKVGGVARVKNELQVKTASERAETAVSDDAIIKDLDHHFRGETQFKHVGYSVKDGAVRLTGTIDSGWDRLQAVRMVRRVPGVKVVHDDLMLSSEAAQQPLPAY